MDASTQPNPGFRQTATRVLLGPRPPLWASSLLWGLIGAAVLVFAFLTRGNWIMAAYGTGNTIVQQADGTWSLERWEPGYRAAVYVSGTWSYWRGPGWERWTATPVTYTGWPGGAPPADMTPEKLAGLRVAAFDCALLPLPKVIDPTASGPLHDQYVQHVALTMLRDGVTSTVHGWTYDAHQWALAIGWPLLSIAAALAMLRAWRLARFRRALARLADGNAQSAVMRSRA